LKRLRKNFDGFLVTNHLLGFYIVVQTMDVVIVMNNSICF